MATYKIMKSTNPNYWVHVLCRKHNFEIIADMPEQSAFGVSSDWESRLPYSLSQLLEKAIGGIASGTIELTGYGPQVQDLSFQMWTGTTPIEIPITFLFDAETSAEYDVYRPIGYLQSLVLPISGTKNFISRNLLFPPGPVRGGGGYGIDIKIGRYTMFKDCILVSANKTLDNRLDSRGFPISGQVECTFRTSIVYGHQDYLEAMGLPPISGVETEEGWRSNG